MIEMRVDKNGKTMSLNFVVTSNETDWVEQFGFNVAAKVEDDKVIFYTGGLSERNHLDFMMMEKESMLATRTLFHELVSHINRGNKFSDGQVIQHTILDYPIELKEDGEYLKIFKFEGGN
jgi:hypothetical protein